MGTPAASVDVSATAASARRRSERARDHRFALPPALRLAGTAYVVAVIPLGAALSWDVTGRVGFITALSVIATALGLPGLAVAVAERRVGGQRLAWRLWAAAFGLVVVAAWPIRQAVAEPWTALEPVVPVAVGTSILLIAAANTLVVRSRSGQRAILVDAADTTMASAAFVVPVALIVGDDIVTSPGAGTLHDARPGHRCGAVDRGGRCRRRQGAGRVPGRRLRADVGGHRRRAARRRLRRGHLHPAVVLRDRQRGLGPARGGRRPAGHRVGRRVGHRLRRRRLRGGPPARRCGRPTPAAGSAGRPPSPAAASTSAPPTAA
jgi:hypothetical protein